MLNVFLGYRIDTKAKIGFSYIFAEHVTLSARSFIGHGTFVNDIDQLVLEEFAKIGNFNWISGVSGRDRKHFTNEVGRESALKMGPHSSITGRHLIDCCNTVSIGSYTTIAGARSQILTHAIDLKLNQQRSSPVTIGSYCFVGSGSIILKGSALPDRSILAAGSTLTKSYEAEYTIYSGVPALPAKVVGSDYLYFQRTNGAVE